MRLIIILFVSLYLSCGTMAQKPPKVEIVTNSSEQKLDILIDGQLFTSYIYSNAIKKPVLWPVVSPGGNEITRSFPLKNKAGERVDHPHHLGIWLNYGDVNSLDFWNNSNAIKPEKAANYGTIRHQQIKKMKAGKGYAFLSTTASWNDYNERVLVEERSQFTIKAEKQYRLIDRTTTLTAKILRVDFTDNKEGMFAIRVARELELPNKKAVKLSDAQGEVIEVENPDNSKVSGDYLSSEGISGAEVWGTRAKWMKLHGTINNEKVAIVIFDHPENVGYPTYWHARSYGLFSANTLGQKALSKGENELNFSLNRGESVTFKYRLAIFSGDPTTEEIEDLASTFAE